MATYTLTPEQIQQRKKIRAIKALLKDWTAQHTAMKYNLPMPNNTSAWCPWDSQRKAYLTCLLNFYLESRGKKPCHSTESWGKWMDFSQLQTTIETSYLPKYLPITS